jgi:hypothetical protein
MPAMSEHRFWAIVNGTLSRDNDPEAQLDALRTALEALSADDIAAFEQRFGELLERANTWDLWAAAHIIHGGCSDDDFDYFRHWLISRGRDQYETAVDNPDTLADTDLATVEDACQFENFSYVAADVWHEKTNHDRDDPDSGFPFATPSGDEPEGEPFEEDEEHLSQRLPKLWERYGDDPLG